MLIQYTLYNRLIVWEPFLLQFHPERIPDTSWLQVRKEESKKWNWNTFTQFVKQYLKTKERERTLSSIKLSSGLWWRVGRGGGGRGGGVVGQWVETSIPSPFPCQSCGWDAMLQIVNHGIVKPQYFKNSFFFFFKLISYFFSLVSSVFYFERKHLDMISFFLGLHAFIRK